MHSAQCTVYSVHCASDSSTGVVGPAAHDTNHVTVYAAASASTAYRAYIEQHAPGSSNMYEYLYFKHSTLGTSSEEIAVVVAVVCRVVTCIIHGVVQLAGRVAAKLAVDFVVKAVVAVVVLERRMGDRMR